MEAKKTASDRRPLVFDIKRTSTSDGPGIRTVVFLKGCNLDCFWCHNPEGKRPEREIAFFAEKCIGCGACKKVCGHQNDGCVTCGDCVLYCPSEARKCYGIEYTDDELCRILFSDEDYYRISGGGMTFSGGECMLYPEYVASIAKRCAQRGISVAIDTAGAVPYAHFETVLPYVDLFLYDIKALDSDLHRRGTGVPNERILENLERLRETGKRIIIRTPVIPGFNEGEEIERIRAYCEARSLPVEFLAYHAMGDGKKAALDALRP